jgi:hypothetical protein
VQIPCIERNAVASVKAIAAVRMALHGDGTHHVSLDTAIKTMRDTRADMKDKYKETSRGGLALNVVELEPSARVARQPEIHVEPRGFEPLTSALQRQRSTN